MCVYIFYEYRYVRLCVVTFASLSLIADTDVYIKRHLHTAAALRVTIEAENL